MASVTATINVQINAANAAAQLTALQGKVASMNKGMLAATAGGVMAQEKAIKRMGNVLGSSGMFTTGIRNVHTELGRMHKEFDRGSTTLSNYRKNSRMWSNDHSAINRLAADRVKMLQSQYVALGKEMNGVQKAMQIKPTGMMREFGADAMYATQQQMLFRRNLQMGSTALVNWGKNTQWAGRQMMVGMGIPIALVAAGAIKSFNDIEKSSIAFKRVYGDTTTTVAEKSQMLAKVQQTVGKEMLKYGVSMADTLDMSARAAATGAKGADLIAATRETMRLATLGNMDYNKSLDAVIAMQTAFNIKSSDMAKTTDFLNAVENQTILSMQDMAVAVPRVAPVIKGLGGNVQDLAVMMTALRQGGVSAEQGANALKSGLGSLLNPTSTAIKQFDGLGINLQKIVDTNKGDIIGTLQGLGKALDGLTKYDRQRALEGLFGKYQYSRMGALLKNINSKAAKETMKLAKTNAGELARMSNQELSQISDSPMIKLKAAIEGIKAAAAPLGAVLSDIAAKIVNIATPIVSFFSNNDIAKWALIGTAGIAALAGTFTMVVGVLANFAGSMVKAGMSVKNFFRIITGRGSLAYITSEELEASAAANSLATAAERAGQGLMAESRAAQLLTSQLNALSAAQLKAAGSAGALASAPTALQAASRQAGHASYPITNQKALASLLAADPQRGHIGGTRPLSVDEILALPTPSARNKTAAALVAKAKAEAEAFKADTTGTVPAPTLYGKSNMTLVQSKALNNLTSAGMPARQWASIIGAQPIGATMSNMFETVGLNMGLKTAEERLAFAQSDVGKRLAETVVGSAVTHMNELGDQRVQDIGRSHQKYGAQMSIDSMLPSVIKDAVQRADLPEEVKRAVAKTADVGWVGTDSKTKLSNMGVSASYEALTKRAASEGGKTVSDITRSYAQMLPKAPLDGVPTTITDNVGKPIANILPEGSPQGKRIAATTRQFSYGKGLSYTADQLRKVTPTAPTQPSALQTQRLMERTQRRQLTGNGMMGIGMLASTAMMGMEMAGKQVPMAAQFAANGLMGVGMAAQMFPTAGAKLTAGLSAVTGMLGPWGLAIGALAAALGGAAFAWRKINIDARERGNQYGKAMADATQYANEVATAYGNTSYVVQQQLKESKTTPDQLNASQQFIQSPAGKAWMEGNSKLMMKVGPAIASSSLAMQVASWVVQGVMTTDNINGMVAALNQQSPGSGTAMAGQLEGLMGKGYKTKDMAALSNKILSSQILDATRASAIFKEADAKTGGAGIKDWIQGIFGGPLAAGVSWLTGGGSEGAKNNFAPMGAPLAKNIEDRVASQEMVAATAGVWNSQLKTAFSNRMAVEARLKQMVDERDDLAKKKAAGTATAQDLKNLKSLQGQIDSTTASSKKFNESIAAAFEQNRQMNSAGNETWYSSQLDAVRNAGKKDSTGLTTYMAESINDAKNAQQLTLGQANVALSALNTGIISPAAASNLTDFGNQMARLPAIIDALPAPKLQDFANEIGNMTGPQAQQALQNFGSRFMNAAKAANLSAREAGLAASKLGANKEQVRQVKINVRADKVKDPTAGLKNKNISVSALTGPAETRLQKLKKLAEQATGKKIKIDANSNADAVTKKLRHMIRTAEAANGKGVHVKTDTNAPSTTDKLNTLGGVIDSVAGAGIIPLNVQDNATPVAKTALDALNTVGSLTPSPAITVDSNAAAVAATTQAAMNSVENVTRYIDVYTRNHKASGGLFRYASGGIHKGDGKVRGPGGPTDDKVNAHLSDGEYVIKASSVEKYGVAFMSAVNRGVYKGGFAKGSPGVPIKGSLPPKENDGNSRAVQFGNDYRNVMFEADNIVKEFKFFGNIMKDARKLLGKNFKSMGYEFTKYIVDNFDPKQIQKMFGGKKDVGAKKIRKQYQTEQKYAALDEAASAAASARGSRGISQLLAKELKAGSGVNRTNAIAGMSPEQFQSYKAMGGGNRNRYLDNLAMTQRAQTAIQEAADKRQRQKDTDKSYKRAGGKNLMDVVAYTGLNVETVTKYADALGMSMEELSQQIEDKTLPKNFAAIGEAAVKASKAMEILAMTAEERTTQKISNNDQKISNIQALAAARGRESVRAKFGKSQSVLEAESAVREAQNAIAQGQIDDINEKYDKQLNILDQIGQHQQAIANLERGRMSVANALSQGDIAAAASAAQQQRNDMAQFARDQMRNQLENQQKAQTMLLQDQINERSRINRDIQNQIALITAQANLEQADAIGNIQAQSDGWMTAAGYVDAMNAALETQNGLLSQTVAQLQAAVAAQAQIIPDMPKSDVAAPISGPVGGVVKAAVKKNSGKKKGKKGRAFGGFIPGVGNSDSVPTMLTPGEFVVRKAAAAKFGPVLRDMNYGSVNTGDAIGGGNVKIDNVVFNINGANLNEREVADIAVRKMHSLNSATIRGGRF